MRSISRALLLAGSVGLLAGTTAKAETLDLTLGAVRNFAGDTADALYVQTSPQPTGTGVIDPFVRIQNNGSESGYNTDYRPVEFDTKDQNQWTHSLLLTDVPIVTFNGVQYRQFLLDINEGGNNTLERLSLNEVEIYLGATGSEHNYPNLGTKIYELDAGGTDNTLTLHYRLNSGSGSGDMFLLVKNDLFLTSPNPYVYLYSAFGVPDNADAGFEEWAVIKAPNAVPVPMAVWGGLALLSGLGGFRQMRRRRISD